MWLTLEKHLSFLITFVFPFLAMITDVLIRFMLNIDLLDVGADLALTTVVAFITLLLENLRRQSQHAPAPLLGATGDPRNLVPLIFFVALLFFVCWLGTLLFVSERVTKDMPVRIGIAFGLGLATMFAGSYLFYKLIEPPPGS